MCKNIILLVLQIVDNIFKIFPGNYTELVTID